MGNLSDPQVRAFLMAYAAVETFGFTTENKNEYAARMSEIGNIEGLQAEAEAISADCNRRGLEMSASRVMKNLIWFQERHAGRVTYLPDQNILIVAERYSAGDDPYPNTRDFVPPEFRTDSTDGPEPPRSKVRPEIVSQMGENPFSRKNRKRGFWSRLFGGD